MKNLRWFPFGLGAPHSAQRLFCLPFAGGGASFFLSWRKALPHCAVIPIQYPGRETRMNEIGYQELQTLVNDLADALLPHLDRPYFLLGYSLGAKIGFSLQHRLTTIGAPACELFIPAAHNAPDAAPIFPGSADLPDEEFKRYIQQYGGMPDIVFQDPELAGLLLPILRQDIRLVEHDVPQLPLNSPIVAYAGADDLSAPPANMQAWRKFSRGGFDLRVFAGGHFFARTAQNFLPTLAEDLAQHY